MLWTLLAIPLFLLLYARIQKRRQKFASKFGSLGFLQEANGRPLGSRRHIPPAFFLIGLTVLFFSLARPQTVVSLPKEEGTIILAFDVSGSMAADDIKPTRMEAAKAAVKDFIQRQPLSMQIGVVAFSDNGFTVQPPTNDQKAVLDTITRLSPTRGTALGNGILASLKAIAASTAPNPLLYTSLTPVPTPIPTPMPKGTYTSAVIILLTDGENTSEGNPLIAAQTAADQGVRIYTVGIGSAAGTTIHVNGFTVHTQLDEPMLQQISKLTDGTYSNAQNKEDLDAIYKNLDPQLIIKSEKTEVTAILAGISMLILLIGGTYSLLWFSRLP